MRAMIIKEFRQMRRDKRAMGLMIGLPVMLLVIFGYAARFDVSDINTVTVGPDAAQVAAGLDPAYRVVLIDPAGTAESAFTCRRAGTANSSWIYTHWTCDCCAEPAGGED